MTAKLGMFAVADLHTKISRAPTGRNSFVLTNVLAKKAPVLQVGATPPPTTKVRPPNGKSWIRPWPVKHM